MGHNLVSNTESVYRDFNTQANTEAVYAVCIAASEIKNLYD